MDVSKELKDWFESCIDKDKITDTARVCCVWYSTEQWVDVYYQYDPLAPSIADYRLYFGNTADEEKVTEETWNEALAVGEYIKDLLSVPLVIDRKKGGKCREQICREKLTRRLMKGCQRASRRKWPGVIQSIWNVIEIFHKRFRIGRLM